MLERVSFSYGFKCRSPINDQTLAAQPRVLALQVCAASVRECELVKLLGQSKVLGICIYMSVACDSLRVLEALPFSYTCICNGHPSSHVSLVHA